MFMSDDGKKKGVASMTVPHSPSDQIDASTGFDVAAQELMEAIERKDSAGVKSALKSFISMCMDEDESYEE